MKNLDLLKIMLRRQRNRFLTLGLLSNVIGLGFCLFVGGQDSFFNSLIIFIALSFILIGFKLIYDAADDWNIEEHRLIKTLKYEPEKIVWVYSIRTELAPFGIQLYTFGLLFLKLNDRDEFCVKMPSKDLADVSKSLNGFLKHATFGFTAEREQWYIANPYLLLK